MESTTATTPPPSAPPSHGLRRELRFWEAIALSIAIMAPTAAMALNGTAPAGLIGRAVPLAFIFATVGVLFVSYAFIRLSRYFSHAGSVFASSSVTLGPRARFFSGWALLGTYLAFTCAWTAEVGTGRGLPQGHEHLELGRLHGDRGRHRGADRGPGVRRHPGRHAVAARMEGISVLLIVILMTVIVVKLIGGSAPNHQSITPNVFKIPGLEAK